MPKFLFVPNLSHNPLPQHAAMTVHGLLRKGQEVKILLLERFADQMKEELFTVFRDKIDSTNLYVDEKDLDQTLSDQLSEWTDILLIAPVGTQFLNDIAKITSEQQMEKSKFAGFLQKFQKQRMIGMRENHGIMSELPSYKILKQQGFQFFDFVIDPAISSRQKQAESKLKHYAHNLKTVASEIKEENVEHEQLQWPKQPEILTKKDHDENKNHDYKGKRVLLTIGSTFEAIDPVFGLTAYIDVEFFKAVARRFIKRGAKVTVVGNNVTADEIDGVEQFIKVRTGRELRDAIFYMFEGMDLLFHTMIVTPFRTQNYPLELVQNKIPKDQEEFKISFVRNPDILDQIQKIRDHQKIIYLNVATANLLKDSYQKIKRYNLDMILTTTPLVIKSQQLQALIVTNKGEHISLQQGANIVDTSDNIVDFCLKCWD